MAFVDCVIVTTTVENVFIKLVLYSCIDEVGERSFDITQASKKLALDSHSDNSFVSLAFWSSLASKKTRKFIKIVVMGSFKANVRICPLQNMGITMFSKLFFKSSARFRTLRKKDDLDYVKLINQDLMPWKAMLTSGVEHH